MHFSIVKLENPIRHYSWGSHHAIARWQGRATPTQEPEAEVWIGDHPVAPSRVVESTGTTPLASWLARDPVRSLGAGRLHLPFLTKVLAAARALSVQVHPSAEQARIGFESEIRSGVPDTQRCYRDSNAKHELLVALSPVEALCGFRSDSEVSARLSGVPGAARGLERQGRQDPLAKALFEQLQHLSAAERASTCAELATFASSDGSREAEWVGRLLAEHPGDPLAMAPLFLNPVVLEPGQALVVRPGTLHSYVSGMGVEVMTRSDNVIRGGLTQKHVDGDELMRVTESFAQPAEIIRPQAIGADSLELCYATGTREFVVRTLELEARHSVARAGGQVTVLLCVEGEVTADGVPLLQGEAALVPADLAGYQLTGSSRSSRVFEVSSG